MARWPSPPDLWLQAPPLPMLRSPHWLVKGKPGPKKGSLTFGTWAGIWVGVSAHPPAAGLPPTGLSLWVLPRLCPGDTQRPGGGGWHQLLRCPQLFPAHLPPRFLGAPASLTLLLFQDVGSWFPCSQSPSPLWAAAGWGAEGLARSAVGRRRVVGAVVWAAARSLQHAPLRCLALFRPMEPLPPGWRGSWAGPGGESVEPASIGGIAAALHWHSPPTRPSYVSSFCALLSYDIELHRLPIPSAVQKLPGVVSLNSCLMNKDILLCVIPVDESVTIAHVEPFDSAQDLDCFSTGDQFQDHCLYFTY